MTLLRWILLAALLAPASLRAETERLMVLPFTGDEVKEEVLTGLQALFVDEARKLPDLEVVDLTSRALVIIGDCGGEPSCLGKGLGRLGATRFVLTNVRKLQGGYLLTQSLHNCPAGSELRSTEETLKGRGRALEKLTNRAVVSLLAPDRLLGDIQVDCNIAGAVVKLDGEAVGKTPLPGVFAATEGRHRIRVEKDGYDAFQGEVKVTYGETSALDVRLLRDTTTVPSSGGGASGGGASPKMMRTLASVGAGAGVAAGIFVAGVAVASVVTGTLAFFTYMQARLLEQRAAAGQLILPRDENRLYQWRALWVATILSGLTPVGTAVLSAVVGTVVAVVGVVVNTVTAKEEAPVVDDGIGFRARERSPRESDDAETPVREPRAKKQREPAPEPTEDNLPEGE